MDGWRQDEPGSCAKRSVDAADDGNAGVAKDVCDLGFAEARSVVFKRELPLAVVDRKAAKAVGVCEFSKRPELFVGERRLQFKFGFKECHAEIIARETAIGEADGKKVEGRSLETAESRGRGIA